MKKLFIILTFLCCGFLYAETKTFFTGDIIAFDIERPVVNNILEIPSHVIISIIPYDKAFILKTKKGEEYLEYYITEGMEIHYCEIIWDIYIDYLNYKAKIVEIKPNTFTIEY